MQPSSRFFSLTLISTLVLLPYTLTSPLADPLFHLNRQIYNSYREGMKIMRTERYYEAASSPESPKNVVNVDYFGAKADGTDDSEAFMSAWNTACSLGEASILLVPSNRVYHLKPFTFSGPCRAPLTLKIYGTVKASNKLVDYQRDGRQTRHWLLFDSIQNFEIDGNGVINGNGRLWWQRSCKIDKTRPCVDAPTALTFNECRNLKLNRLRVKNAQQMHVSFHNCVNVEASNLIVHAPQGSPNTDGIHVSGSRNVRIRNSIIATGDDCVSIVSGSRNIEATGITCGPGHGISIGSLGEGNSEAAVSGIVVSGAELSSTTNGVRIKTWQGGKGFARNIKFENIMMHNVTNPIIIDQNYCDQESPCDEEVSAVQISEVLYKNIRGTSASEVAIKLECSKSFPCKGVVLDRVNLVAFGRNVASKASCKNVNFTRDVMAFPNC